MILGIHLGCDEAACVVLDDDGERAGGAARPVAVRSPGPGLSEHDARALWEAVRAAAVDALEDAGAWHVHAIGVAAARDTLCVWDPQTGEPLHPVLDPDDRRAAADDGAHGPAADVAALVRDRAGGRLDAATAGAARIAWLLGQVDGLADRARRGRAVFGPAASWLVHALCGTTAVDAASASRMRLHGLDRGGWDPELLAAFGIPAAALPPLVPVIGPVGRTAGGALPGWDDVPVTALAPDEHAALYGQACLDPGQGRGGFGSGAWLVQLNVGDRPVPPPAGADEVVAWSIGQRAFHALEVAAPAGGTDAATAAGIADALAALQAAAPEPLRELRADGPGSADAALMQRLADALGVPVAVPEVAQTAAMGAALLAGVGCGRWTQGDVRRLWRERCRYEPTGPADGRPEGARGAEREG
jgi:glycerol kinase